MKLQFDCISELGEPGLKFKELFSCYWPSYNDWIESSKSVGFPDIETSQAALKKYMPEMLPLYHKVCKLVNANSTVERFLTGFQPPAYVSGCAQAVLVKNEIQLVRNYDYHPDLIEGTLLLSSWNGKKVIAISDCLIGVLDGMNEDGLAISLTFGGREIVGEGFGIPFIMRYILEFCSNVKEAVKALKRIPCHMAYNVTVVDKSGIFKTVFLSPDRSPVVTDAAFATNHQVEVDWHENAAHNQTIERSAFISGLLDQEEIDANTLADAFLNKPLYNRRFSEGFGTLYTVDYRPLTGIAHLRWLGVDVQQSFDNFNEGSTLINFDNLPVESTHHYAFTKIPSESNKLVPEENLIWGDSKIKKDENSKLESPLEKKIELDSKSREILAEYWFKLGQGFGKNKRNGISKAAIKKRYNIK